MGQYYNIFNLDKKEFLHSWTFNDGFKIMEFGHNKCGMMTALAYLLADGYGSGSNEDLRGSDLIGHWKNDRIVIQGDYTTEEFPLDTAQFKNISVDILRVMIQDLDIARELAHTYKGIHKLPDDIIEIYDQIKTKYPDYQPASRTSRPDILIGF